MARTRTKRYPGRIEPRPPGRFKVRVWVNGRQHTRTIRAKRKREAEDYAIAWHAELSGDAARREAGLPVGVRFSELLARFEAEGMPKAAGAQDAYRDSFKVFRAYFVERCGDPLVAKIRPGTVAEFLSWRRVNRIGGGEVSLRTVQKDRAVLHRLFDFAAVREYVEANPVATVKPPKPDAYDYHKLTEAEYEALLAACGANDRLRLYVLLLGEAGVRSYSEALMLTWQDVRLAERRIWIGVDPEKRRRTKSGAGRWAPITPRLEAEMRDYMARHRLAVGSEYIFAHATTSRHHKRGERVRDMHRSFKSAARRAGIALDAAGKSRLRQHDMRHFFCTRALQNGVPLVYVQLAAGHSDVRTTLGYNRMTDEHLRAWSGGAEAEAAAERKGA